MEQPNHTPASQPRTYVSSICSMDHLQFVHDGLVHQRKLNFTAALLRLIKPISKGKQKQLCHGTSVECVLCTVILYCILYPSFCNLFIEHVRTFCHRRSPSGNQTYKHIVCHCIIVGTRSGGMVWVVHVLIFAVFIQHSYTLQPRPVCHTVPHRTETVSMTFRQSVTDGQATPFHFQCGHILHTLSLGLPHYVLSLTILALLFTIAPQM